jgi:hypothetical protein
MVLALARPLVTFNDCDRTSEPLAIERPGPAYRPFYQGDGNYVSRSILPSGGCSFGDHEFQRRYRAIIAAALHGDTGREVDNKAVGDGEEGVDQGQEKMGRLPEAVERPEA